MDTNISFADTFGADGRGIVELCPDEYDIDDMANEIARTLEECEELSLHVPGSPGDADR